MDGRMSWRRSSLFGGPPFAYRRERAYRPIAGGALNLGMLSPGARGLDVPTPQQVAEKYVRVTAGRAADYTAGIQGVAANEFEAAAIAAADAQALGSQQAIAEGRYAAGLSGSGARWRKKAEQLGSQRFPTGVSAAKDEMASGVQPYLAELAAIPKPPPRPRGDPANLEIVATIAQRLNQRRRQRS